MVVLVVGDSLHTCGEWDDRDDLDLPGGQLALLASVVALKNKQSAGSSSFKIVVVVVGGRPCTFGESCSVLSLSFKFLMDSTY